MSYTVKLEIFEGPLDLLLHLIKENRLDIYDIPIAKITEQYLQYLEIMKLLDLNIAGEFLVMAATLIHIKSQMLLPPEERTPEEEEQDPRDALVQRLLEYSKFKNAADQMHRMELARHEVFARPEAAIGVSIDDVSDVESKPVGFEANIFDLISAFSRIMQGIPKEAFYEIIKDEWTIEEKREHILLLLKTKRCIYFGELFSNAKNKLEIITIFLAILELMRLKSIFALQERPFGEILIREKYATQTDY